MMKALGMFFRMVAKTKRMAAIELAKTLAVNPESSRHMEK